MCLMPRKLKFCNSRVDQGARGFVSFAHPEPAQHQRQGGLDACHGRSPKPRPPPQNARPLMTRVTSASRPVSRSC